MAYIYKTIPVNGAVDNLDPGLLASKVNSLINSQSGQGWEFYQINSVQAYTNPGCFDALFSKLLPGAGGANQAKYDIAIFRKELSQQDFLDIKHKLQNEVNNDTSKPHPNTHVKCPDCKKLVRNEATQCRHCGCKLKPLGGGFTEEGVETKANIANNKSNNSIDNKAAEVYQVDKFSSANNNSPIIESDESLDGLALADLNSKVNPLLNKLNAVGYDLVNSKITKSKTYWRFMYSKNGSICEFNNIKELQDFANNF